MLVPPSATLSAFSSVIPPEVLIHIFKFLSPAELSINAKVCRQWESIVSDNLLWRPISKSLWPESQIKNYENWKKYYIARMQSQNTRVLCNRRGYLYSVEDRYIKIWKQNTLYYAARHRPLFTVIDIETDHTAPITCFQLQYNPYSKMNPRLLTGSADTTIKIWKKVANSEVDSFRCHETLEGHIDRITALATEQDWIFSGSADKSINAWKSDFSKGNTNTRLIHVLKGHAGKITALQIGKRDHRGVVLYSSSGDTTIRVWNIYNEITATCVQTLNGHTGPITCLSASVYDRFIVSGSTDKTIRVWEKNMHGILKIVDCIEAHAGTVRSVQKIRFSPYILSSSDDGSVKIWKKHKYESSWKFKGLLANQNEPVQAISLDYAFQTSTCRKIYTQGLDKAIKIWVSSIKADRYEVLTELKPEGQRAF